MPIWEQYRRIAHLFVGWSSEERARAIRDLNQCCTDGKTHTATHWWKSTQPEVDMLIQVTGLTTYMAVRMALEGYLSLHPKKVEELLARKIPTTRLGWR